VIAGTFEQAREAVRELMVAKRFGASGDTVVIEDFLPGQEISVHAFCDDRTAVLFPASQDHKQAYDGDKGPNTGGMGVIAPVPWVTRGHLDTIEARIVQPALDGLRREHAGFVGCLYPGLMIDGDTVKVVEFNARFGDPEAQTYMRLLDGDLYEILDACTRGSSTRKTSPGNPVPPFPLRRSPTVIPAATRRACRYQESAKPRQSRKSSSSTGERFATKAPSGLRAAAFCTSPRWGRT